MSTSSYRDCGFPAAPSGADEVSRRREGLVYQIGTIAAILLLLGGFLPF